MFDFERAAQYAARHGISRFDLEEALRSRDLDAGVLPQGGWLIAPADLEEWVANRSA